MQVNNPLVCSDAQRSLAALSVIEGSFGEKDVLWIRTSVTSRVRHLQELAVRRLSI